MGRIGPTELLILLVLFGIIFVGVPWLSYRHGKKVGEQAGYIRGYKEGQGSKTIDGGKF